jgi:hypothetical protein
MFGNIFAIFLQYFCNIFAIFLQYFCNILKYLPILAMFGHIFAIFLKYFYNIFAIFLQYFAIFLLNFQIFHNVLIAQFSNPTNEYQFFRKNNVNGL